jgi:hypothetical protein
LKRSSAALLVLWAALSIAVTAGGLRWHLNYFASYGPRFEKAFPWFAASLGLALLVYQRYLRKYVWKYELAGLAAFALLLASFYQPQGTAIALCMGACAFAVGRRLLTWLRLDPGGVASEIGLSAALGFGVFICALFALGLAKLYYAWVFAGTLVVIAVVMRRELVRVFALARELNRKWAETPEFARGLPGVMLVFAAIFVFVTGVVALAPSIAFDALAAHLAAARFYAMHHALAPLPLLAYSYYPQGFEELLAMAYSLGGQPAAQMLPPLFFALALLMTFALARACGCGRVGAWMGVVLAAATPFLHWDGGVVKPDLALALSLLAALNAFLLWNSSRNARWLWVSAFLLASAFGVKHVALFGAVPLCLLYARAVWRERRITLAVTLLLILVLFGTYWQLRTFALTGNPVYPARLRAATAALDGRVTRSLATPWRVQFDGSANFESASPTPVGIFLLLLAPLWFLMRSQSVNRAERICLFFIALYLLYWSLAWAILRYAAAPFLLLTTLTGARLERLATPKWARRLAIVAVFYSFVFALCVVAMLELNAPQFELLAGRLDGPGYLGRWLDTYASIEYAGQHAGPRDLILGVDNCAAAYLPKPENLLGVCNDAHRYSREDVRRLADTGAYRFVILPHKFDLGLTPEYSDQFYSVYRLPQ